MNAHTQNTTEEKSGHDPGTPVIVKSGSNGPPGSNTVEVIIDSQYVPFSQFVQESNGKMWRSRSMLKGRIHKLSILESPDQKPDVIKQPYHQELASLTIEYGTTQSLHIRESGNTANQDVVLEIKSEGTPFEIATPGPWHIATAWFPSLTRVVFKGGNEVLVNREFNETNQPTLSIEFLKPTVG